MSLSGEELQASGPGPPPVIRGAAEPPPAAASPPQVPQDTGALGPQVQAQGWARGMDQAPSDSTTTVFQVHTPQQ